MYEVDGVFWSDKKNKIVDERTQLDFLLLI
jgi:hypothetical protein